MSCCRRRAMRAQKQNSDEHRAVSPGRKTFELFSLGPQKKCFYYKELRPQFYQIHWHWGLCHHVTAPSIPTNLSLRLLDPDLPQAMIVGDIHRIARHATHLETSKISNKDKRENWTSVLVKVMFGRQTVRKCGLSRPGGEKLLMFGSFGCFETHELVAFEFCCLLELTYCVLACVSQQLGH